MSMVFTGATLRWLIHLFGSMDDGCWQSWQTQRLLSSSPGQSVRGCGRAIWQHLGNPWPGKLKIYARHVDCLKISSLWMRLIFATLEIATAGSAENTPGWQMAERI